MRDPSHHLAAYRGFVTSLMANDAAAARAYVDPNRFVAILPAETEIELPFGVFLEEVGRRRRPFSDFGQHVEELTVVEQGPFLAVHWRMTVTYDGPLGGWNDRSVPAPAHGGQITFTAIDLVQFDPDTGQIIRVTQVSDRLPIVNTMGEMH